MSVTIYYMVPWVHASLPTKWHLKRLSHFCWVYSHDGDQQTDHTTPPVGIDCAMHAMWTNKVCISGSTLTAIGHS